MAITLTEFELPSGLKVKYAQTTKDATFNVIISIKVGSRDEPVKYSGICHFLEHAMFRGSSKYPETRQFHRELGSFSGSANGATGRESHCFTFTGDAEKFLIGLDFIEDFFFTPQFTNLDTERQVVIQEIYGEEDPLCGMESQVFGDIFKGSRFANNICGSEETVSQMSEKILKAWRAKFYSPGNCTLYLSSQQTLEEVKAKLLNSAFSRTWDYVKNPITRDMITLNRRLPKPAKESITTIHNPNKDGQFTGALSFITANPTSEESIAMWMLENILVKVEGVSPLWEATRGEGLVYDIDHNFYDYSNFMFSSIGWESSQENIVPVFEIIMTELQKIANGNIVDWDYHKDRLLFKNKTIMLETPTMDLMEHHIGKEVAPYTLLCHERAEVVTNLTQTAVVNIAKKLLNGPKNWAVLGYRASEVVKKLKSKVIEKQPLIAV